MDVGFPFSWVEKVGVESLDHISKGLSSNSSTSLSALGVVSFFFSFKIFSQPY